MSAHKFGPKRQMRGKPVRALLVLLGAWVLLRAALWQSPLALPDLAPQQMIQATAAVGTVLSNSSQSVVARAAEPAALPDRNWRPAPLSPVPLLPAPLSPALVRPIEPTQISAAALPGTTRPMPVRRILGHTMLLAAGIAQMPLDPALLPFVPGGGPRAPHLAANPVPAFAPVAADRFARETAAAPRWSMDAWALWREDDNSPLLSGRPSYGRSQIGAVLRFRLAPSSGHAPQAHLRASAALAGANEQEAALGLSARPLPGVPIRLAGEARLRETRAGAELRAAAYAVSEFPPLPLPGGTTGEAYVQGGYVTGSSATGFVDGQARITRELADAGRFRLSAGGGAWGGAQEGSGRLDIGPSASVSVSAGGLNARMSADYRFRVAGAAQPASGPTLTISAGF